MVVKKWTPRAEEEVHEEDAIPMWVHLYVLVGSIKLHDK